MNLYQFVEKGQVAILEYYLPKIADSGSVTVTVYSNTGTSLGSPTIQTYLVSSSISNDSPPGRDYVNTDSITGFKVGQQLILTSPYREEHVSETVTVKAISTPPHKITFQRALTTSRVTGDVIGESRIKLTLSAAQTANIGKNYVIRVNYTVLGEAQPTLSFSFTVSKYLPVSNLTLDYLSGFDPTIVKKLPGTAEFNKLKLTSWSMLLKRLAANYNPGALVGTINFTDPHAYLFFSLIYEQAGEQYEQQRIVMMERYEKEFLAACGSAAYDEKQNGNTTNILLKKIVLKRV